MFGTALIVFREVLEAALIVGIGVLPVVIGVAMVVPFGATLHVSGNDEAELEQSLRPYFARSDLTWERAEPGLEDVFIGGGGGAPVQAGQANVTVDVAVVYELTD